MTSEPGASKSRQGPIVPPSPTPGDNRKDRPERAPPASSVTATNLLPRPAAVPAPRPRRERDVTDPGQRDRREPARRASRRKLRHERPAVHRIPTPSRAPDLDANDPDSDSPRA